MRPPPGGWAYIQPAVSLLYNDCPRLLPEIAVLAILSKMMSRVVRVTFVVAVSIFPMCATLFAEHMPSLAELARLPLARIAQEVYPEGSTAMFPAVPPNSLNAVRVVVKEQIDNLIETHNRIWISAHNDFPGLQRSPNVRVEVIQGTGPFLRTQSDGLITLNIRLLQADIVGGLQAQDRHAGEVVQDPAPPPEKELTRLMTHMQAMRIDLARHSGRKLNAKGVDEGWIGLLIANEVFTNVLRFQLLHEIGHVVLSHFSDECDSKHCALFEEDELAADRYATYILTATWKSSECPNSTFFSSLNTEKDLQGFDAFFVEVYGLAGFHGEKDCGCNFPANQMRLAASRQALNLAAAAGLNPKCTSIYK